MKHVDIARPTVGSPPPKADTTTVFRKTEEDDQPTDRITNNLCLGLFINSLRLSSSEKKDSKFLHGLTSPALSQASSHLPSNFLFCFQTQESKAVVWYGVPAATRGHYASFGRPWMMSEQGGGRSHSVPPSTAALPLHPKDRTVTSSRQHSHLQTLTNLEIFKHFPVI